MDAAASLHGVQHTCHAALAAGQMLEGCLTRDWQPEHSRALVRCGRGKSSWCALSACTGSRAAQAQSLDGS